MKVGPYHIVLALLLALAAGCLGALAAGHWERNREPRSLHDFVHEELDLSPTQDAELDRLEESFSIERKRHQASLRRANAELALAMEEEHRYGPKVSAAIDRVHEAMGELQKATVEHVFDMRDLLDETQAIQFDRQVSRSLTEEPAD